MRRRYVLDSKFQTIFTLKFTIGVGALLAVLTGLFVGMLHVLGNAEILDLAQREIIRRHATDLLSTLLLLDLFFVLLSAAFAFYWSFKLVGPLSRVESWLSSVLAGEPAKAPVLRPRDELKDIAELLAEIVDKHKARLKG